MGGACVKSQRDNGGRDGGEEDSEDERGPSKNNKQNKRVKVLLLGTSCRNTKYAVSDGFSRCW